MANPHSRMRLAFACFALALSTACGRSDLLTPTPTTSATTRAVTIVIGGQSNAIGWASGPAGVYPPTARMWDPATLGWIQAADEFSFFARCGGDGICRGGWPTFVADLSSLGTLHLTGYAESSTFISDFDANAFHPTIVASASTGADVFVWFQGEQDAPDPVRRAAYGDKLRTLVARVRAETHSPNLLWIEVGLGPAFGGIMDAIQQAAIAEDSRAVWLRTDDLPYDGLHLTYDGYQAFGHRLAAVVRAAR